MKQPSQTYLNPVYSQPCPDPFVLKWAGEYWAYGSGPWHDGRYLGILHSTDLVHWRDLGGALEPLPGGHTMYWAPEVSYLNGVLYMYYSVGNETLMAIRVATAAHPAGPFVDRGHRLTNEEFAIDAHVFTDDDGSRYLFYATDFPQHTHVGTGTTRDRMLDPWTLAGEPQPVVRARYDWQVYDPQRAEKDGVRWHTIEGSFVLKHKGRYYHMFSGGNWQNVSYGVSYAITEDIAAAEEWRQVADGEQVLPIIRTIPGAVIGPGHNSVVRGPDNQQLFCVYHRWAHDGSGRVIAIDRLDWVGERMIVLGPSVEPQPVPNPATTAGWDGWMGIDGDWDVRDGVANQAAVAGRAAAQYDCDQPYFVLEASAKVEPKPSDSGTFGLALSAKDDTVLQWTIDPANGRCVVDWQTTGGMQQADWALPSDFNPAVYHLLRCDVNGQTVRLLLDDVASCWHGMLADAPTSVRLHTEHSAVAWAGIAITHGWQDLFTESATPTQLGWRTSHSEGDCTISDQQMWCDHAASNRLILTKAALFQDYEAVVNVRLAQQVDAAGGYGLCLCSADQPLLTLLIAPAEDAWSITHTANEHSEIVLLPPAFDPTVYQQFRLRTVAGELTLHWEAALLLRCAAPAAPTTFGLLVQGAQVAYDMVRVTNLN